MRKTLAQFETKQYPFINFVNKSMEYRKLSIIDDIAWAIVIQLIHLINDFLSGSHHTSQYAYAFAYIRRTYYTKGY